MTFSRADKWYQVNRSTSLSLLGGLFNLTVLTTNSIILNFKYLHQILDPRIRNQGWYSNNTKDNN